MAKNPRKRKKRGRKDGWLAVQLAALTNAKYKSQTYRQGVLVGQVFGILTLIAGFVLSVAGISGSIEWLVEASGLTSRLTNATPGVVFVIVDMIIIWRYKPHVSHDIQFDREGGVSGRPLQGHGGGWRRLSADEGSSARSGTMRERVTYREEQRGVGGALENRSMAGRIQHGEVRIQKKDS